MEIRGPPGSDVVIPIKDAESEAFSQHGKSHGPMNGDGFLWEYLIVHDITEFRARQTDFNGLYRDDPRYKREYNTTSFCLAAFRSRNSIV